MPRSPEGSARANRGPAAGPENRRSLIAAAREIYAEQGLGAPLSSVARRAGVGQGSLYRHFPDRLALASAVFLENVSELEVAVPSAREATLETLFDLIVAQAIVSTAFIELVRTADPGDEQVRLLGMRFQRVVETLLARGRASGHVGPHVETADVLLVTSMLATEIARADEPQRAAVAARARVLIRRAFA